MTIIDRSKLSQIKNFGHLAGTDIDFTCRQNGVRFLVELKAWCRDEHDQFDRVVKKYQRETYEEFSDSIYASGKKCYSIIATHCEPDSNDIDVPAARVIFYYTPSNKQWYDIQYDNPTVLDFINSVTSNQ